MSGSRQFRVGDWASQRAPTLNDIDALAREAFARLPEAFRSRCESVAILVEDFPDDATLDEMEIESDYDLLGLYQGVDLTQQQNLDAPIDVNRIFLYRRPLLDYWAEYDESLGDLVTHVLVHEIGHHFGLSDEEMEAIEEAAL